MNFSDSDDSNKIKLLKRHICEFSDGRGWRLKCNGALQEEVQVRGRVFARQELSRGCGVGIYGEEEEEHG